MKRFRAADLTRHTGDVFDAASREPVVLTKHRRPRFVIMSVRDFEALAARQPGQRVYAVGDMPEDVGDALDAALDEALADE